MSNSIKENWIEIVDNKNILWALVLRNLYGKYKTSLLGFSWHFIMPLIMLIVYYIVFSEIRTTPIENFWIFLAAGVFPFNFMVTNVIGSSGFIINSSNILKKVPGPKCYPVLSQLISNFIVYIISIITVVLLIILDGHIQINYSICTVIIESLLMFIFVLGGALIISSITVYVRDIQHFLASVYIIFFFITPLYFAVDTVSADLQKLIWLNPFSYYIESFHATLYYGVFPDMLLLKCSIISLLSLIIGIGIFFKLQKGFIERV